MTDLLLYVGLAFLVSLLLPLVWNLIERRNK